MPTSTNLILFDFSNLAHRCLHIKQIRADSDNPAWDLWQYMIFNAMYEYVLQTAADFEADTTEIVLALDSITGYWRRNLYPPYKVDRAEKRASDGIDWASAYQEFEKITKAISENLPWKVLRVPNCEADDVIYALATSHKNGKVFIHSGDSDYVQLVSENVSVYNPIKGYIEFPGNMRVAGKDVWCDTPAEYLQYAILTGQGGKDNVFNVRTPTDWDCTKRKPGFGVSAAAKVLGAESLEAELVTLGLLENYQRNAQLIDLTALPEDCHVAIMSAYNSYTVPNVDVPGFLSNYNWPSMASDMARNDMDLVLRNLAGEKVFDDSEVSIIDSVTEFEI